MTPGARLRTPWLALLLVALAAAPFAMRAVPQHTADRARAEARAAALDRLAAAGLPRTELEGLAHRSAIEELAQGYPDDETAARAGTALAIALGLLLLGAAWVAVRAISDRLDADLTLLARRLEAMPAGAGATRFHTDGLAFVETTHLGNAIRRALPETTPTNAAERDQREDTRRQRSHFLASMSHDLRSPLNSILGFAELVLRGADGPVDDALRAPLDTIRRTGKALLRLINQILDTARCEAGRMSLERRPTLVASLLREAVEELRRAHDLPPDVEIEPALQPGIEPVEVDRVRIVQALAQLLGEAVGATRAGVVRLSANERKQGDARLLLLEVEGPGALRPGLPARFSAAFRVLAPGDLGLAVPLSRALIELHGGALVIDEGPPSRFTITLPAAVRRQRIGVLRAKKS